MKIYENNEYSIFDFGFEELYYVWPKDNKLDPYYTDEPNVRKIIKESK